MEALKSMLQPLRQAEFSEKLYKVSVYVQSVARSYEAYRMALADLETKKEDDANKHAQVVQAQAEAEKFTSSLKNSIRFARLNLDAAMVQALEILVWRPKNATKTDEQKKIQALQKTFDRLENPGQAMLEHYRTSSDPLNKYLVARTLGA